MNAARYSLLSELWLHEPDAGSLARAHAIVEAGQAAPLHTGDTLATLAAAYADLFLLNVYPYGTAYTDAWSEINTPAARRVAAQYEAHGYRPGELSETGAPDHLGLCLGFVAYLCPSPAQPEGNAARAGFLDELAAWAPVCCLAAEREPGAHSFYRSLARLTRETLLADIPAPVARSDRPQRGGPSVDSAAGHQPEDELRLRDVVRFLLAPARCGLFLSRARLGQFAMRLGMRLPFGSRFEVAEWLFAGAGESDQVPALVRMLDAEAAEWALAYRAWAAQWPAWQPHAAQWLARVEAAQRLLGEMQRLAQTGADVEYADPAGADAHQGDS